MSEHLRFRSGVIVFAILLFVIASNPEAASLASSETAYDDEKTRASDLWEAAVTAKGGRERLRSVNSLYVAREQPEGDRACHLFVFPDRDFAYLYGAKRDHTVINVYNGLLRVNWWQSGNSPAQFRQSTPEHRDDEEIRRAQLNFMLATRWLEPKPLRARKGWHGLRRVDVLETDADGWRVDFYLDPKTHLPVKIVSGASYVSRAEGDLNYEVTLGGYEEVGGLMMPHKLTHSTRYTRSANRWSERVSRYEINPAHSEQVFEKAPTPRMGPEAWRPAVAR